MMGQLLDDILRAIDKWNPGDYSTEKKYQVDLVKFLRKELNNQSMFGGPQQKVSVKEESGRSVCDVAVENIGIELKRNLKGKSRVDRLSGQIDRYKKHYSDVIILLCGETHHNAQDDIESIVRDKNRGGGFGSQEPQVILKVKPPEDERDSKPQRSSFW